MSPFIELEKLSKRYDIQRQGTRDLWALRDVSFSAGAGEIFGIIGKNGAGKSTLLKVLAGITEPTGGRALLWRQPASLLELGTGFHPDLSGRENVFLNAALFGMRRREVRRRFDAIVDFAGLAAFIDTPVKHYSSGMAVRLAFSVAAHLDRELLLLDEALAVGDFAFQQKSVAKIGQLAEQGACVLLVSHNLGLIERICHRTLLLHQGETQFLGPSAEAVREYLSCEGERPHEFLQPAAPEKKLQVRRVVIVGEAGETRTEVGYHEGFRLVVEYEIHREAAGTNVGIGIASAGGALLFATAEFDCDSGLRQPRPPGYYRAEVAISPKWLNVGRFVVQVYSSTGMQGTDFTSQDALVFDVIETGTPAARHGQSRHGLLQPELPWVVRRVDVVK